MRSFLVDIDCEGIWIMNNNQILKLQKDEEKNTYFSFSVLFLVEEQGTIFCKNFFFSFHWRQGNHT
jgi:hypothetical protein